ncbi:hypothetical protein CYMTET_19883 [Cymbomonas tetramitiformis]|uniref:Uncharacterized protein n=1 Tax=Cymbomonas tetramitiformis TaxID=36881 RepID=A0AAE0L4R0_9CHLO|nr:hypothetical protein CYMTET_19883 [Cymbomonas tetramitiformis]
MRLVCLAGQRRVTQPETAQRELLPHGGTRINLCKEARCAWTRCTRRALPPGTMRLVCLAGQRRVTQPETAQRELLPHGGAPGALAVAAICHSRRALSPPKEKRSAPGRFALGGPKGRARRRVTQPETALRELLPHGGAPGALAVAAICHSRRALSPPNLIDVVFFD